MPDITRGPSELEYRSAEAEQEVITLFDELRRGRPKEGPLQQVLGHVKALGLKSVVLEPDYVDRDYRDEFANVYAKSFRSYPDRCTRVHFFARSIKCRGDLRSDDPDYLGYCVLRPVEVGIVGRTLLRPWRSLDRAYFLSVQEAEVHIAGVRLKATGAPFIQQDGMAITCAQSSMWMVLRYISSIVPMRLAGPYEISRVSAAESPFEQRIVPSSGLSARSMVQGFKNLGLGTLFEMRPSIEHEKGVDCAQALWMAGWDPVARIYASIESRMPVIALLNSDGRFGHAVTVVGHLHRPEVVSLTKAISRAKLRRSTGDKVIVPSHEWTDAFIVHDDSTGPYRILPVDERARKELESEEPYCRLLTPKEYAHVEGSVTGLVSPMPDKVYLTGDVADEQATSFLSYSGTVDELQDAERCQVRSARALMDSMNNEKDPAVIRTYFIRSEDFKKALQVSDGSQDDEMLPKVRDAFLATPMPTYIWLSEISTLSLFSSAREQDRRIVGEMVLDATSNKSDTNPFIMCHLPGVILSFDRTSPYFAWEVETKREIVLGDRPYRHQSRLV